jgi:endonuclease YncB( thermonuclease family)
MIEADKRKSIYFLDREGMTGREISRRLGVSRNTVERIIKQQGVKALSDMVLRKVVVVTWKRRGRYRRIIGQLYLREMWINRELVARGWAWQFKRYSRSKELGIAESKAQRAARGLWAAPIGMRGRPAPLPMLSGLRGRTGLACGMRVGSWSLEFIGQDGGR